MKIKRYKHKGKNMKPDPEGDFMLASDVNSYLKNYLDDEYERRERRWQALLNAAAVQLVYLEKGFMGECATTGIGSINYSPEERWKACESEAGERYNTDPMFNRKVHLMADHTISEFTRNKCD